MPLASPEEHPDHHELADRPVPYADAGSAAVVAVLRQLVRDHRDGRPPNARLKTAARVIAADAHRRGLPPEATLVALKDEWTSLDEAYHLSPLDARALLSRLVTLSIRAYYRPGHAPEPPPDAHPRVGADAAS